MSDITIREPNPADDEQVVTLYHLTSREYPKSSAEEYRGRLESIPAGVPFVHFAAEQDGAVVGYADLLQQFWTDTAGAFHASVVVHPDRWRQGIGGALYRHLADAMPVQGAERVYAEIGEDRPQSLAFAAQRGFKETGIVARMSRLTVPEASLDGYVQLRGKLEGEGIRVATVAELGRDNDQLLREVHAVGIKYSEDIPSSEAFTMGYDQWREFLETFPGMSMDAIFVAMAGSTVIGTANLQREGADSAYNSGTGILREYRGRGVARLLKYRQIEWARDHGIQSLYTGNDINNPRMFDINVRLGYQPLPSRIEVVLAVS